MPTYEYACSSCKSEWEELQKISEPAIEVCPKCHAKTAQRLISGGNFILKGGGWYADAYSSVKPGAKSDSSETKTESKPESTAPKTEVKTESVAPKTESVKPAKAT